MTSLKLRSNGYNSSESTASLKQRDRDRGLRALLADRVLKKLDEAGLKKVYCLEDTPNSWGRLPPNVKPTRHLPVCLLFSSTQQLDGGS